MNTKNRASRSLAGRPPIEGGDRTATDTSGAVASGGSVERGRAGVLGSGTWSRAVSCFIFEHAEDVSEQEGRCHHDQDDPEDDPKPARIDQMGDLPAGDDADELGDPHEQRDGN